MQGFSLRTWIRQKLKALCTPWIETRPELSQALQESVEAHLMDDDARAMIEGVLEVSAMQVRDIMVPTAQSVVLSQHATWDDALPKVIESAHSRFPVVQDDKPEDVVGILLAKDLLQHAFHGPEDFSLKELIRPAVFVPESKSLDVLLKEFRLNHHHMAIVVDEYGNMSGVVTIEDILEQIVGDIEDEHDVDEETLIKPLDAHTFVLKALLPIEAFNAHFNAHLDDDAFDTLGGLLLQTLGHVPKRGEHCTLGDYTFEILHADHRRIHLIKMVKTHA